MFYKKRNKMYFIRRYKTKNMIFVNSCNLSKNQAFMHVRRRVKKKRMKQKIIKKRKSEMQAMFD